ncbi:hypothetical protein M231_04038 [Tremella mesenterica]|uniref:Methyltransferase domain-containing protein n=1 Tax=Tremella mesenterica TaxID=5217 RepID=A0A4Q1BLQ4_TREME|nr:hypothetical protein M231_04038 [Tremella mesenterica]
MAGRENPATKYEGHQKHFRGTLVALRLGRGLTLFQADRGRRYQAKNEDYVRLDTQHRAFKERQLGRNFLAPIDEVLNDGSDYRKGVLDIGTGTGIWAREIAAEYPDADVIGLDLSPMQSRKGVPPNCKFVVHDASKGFPFPTGFFEVVHCRLLMSGIRDWRAFIDEAVRVVRPGGLLVMVECDGWRHLNSGTEEEQRALAPGFFKLRDYIIKGLRLRGLDAEAGSTTVPNLLMAHPGLEEFNKVYAPLPMWPWSDDPVLRRVGEHMLVDARELPEACRKLVVDVCDISNDEYNQLVRGWRDDVGKPGVTSLFPVWHNWAFKAE